MLKTLNQEILLYILKGLIKPQTNLDLYNHPSCPYEGMTSIHTTLSYFHKMGLVIKTQEVPSGRNGNRPSNYWRISEKGVAELTELFLLRARLNRGIAK